MLSFTHTCFGVRSLSCAAPMAKKLGSTLVIGLFFLMLLSLTFALGQEALDPRLDSGRPLPLVITGERGRTYKCIQILHYFGPKIPPSKPLPIGPNGHIHLFIKRARTIRLNLMANAARPNPQASFHYGAIPNVRILFLENTAAETKPCTYEKVTAEIKRHPAEIKFFPAETGHRTHKKTPAETEHFPPEAKACTHKKSPAETEPFPAETKSCSHVVHVLPRNRRLLGKLPDVNVNSPPSISNKQSWNLEKEDPPSPPAPSGNQPIHN